MSQNQNIERGMRRGTSNYVKLLKILGVQNVIKISPVVYEIF